MSSHEIVLSGIRPTGFLHLGNYFGAIQNYIKMQDEYNCYFFVANWHSLTTHPDTKLLQQGVLRVIAENIASGLNPEKACLYVQSEVPEIAELYLYLNMLSYKGELEKTTTFKEKARSQPNNINSGLLTYPVLQAADILIHRAIKVPVGKDQEQNLEMARNFAERFNHRYGDVFPMPFAFNYGNELIKILSLDGDGKMSKSENQYSTIYLSDDDATILKKMTKAKTDQGPSTEYAPKPDYIENLFTIMKLVSPKDCFDYFNEQYNKSSAGNCIIRYGDFKKTIAEDLIKFITPIREKTNSLLEDNDSLVKIIKQGTEKARMSASNTLNIVRKQIGMKYY